MNEIPETEFGLKQYIRYALKQINFNEKQNQKLQENIKICEDKLLIKESNKSNESNE